MNLKMYIHSTFAVIDNGGKNKYKQKYTAAVSVTTWNVCILR